MILIENSNNSLGIDNEIKKYAIDKENKKGIILDIYNKYLDHNDKRSRIFLNIIQITLLRDHLSQMLINHESKTDSNPSS